jgi:DNA-damage-inducible protein D
MSEERSEQEQAEAAAPQASIFEQLRQSDEGSNEFWSARDLAEVLGYETNYRNFKRVIEKAMFACENSGLDPLDHFAEASKTVELGSGAKRQVEDVHLSRYACYLIVQNADPSKEIVALGQTYFAVQTRRAEVADEMAALSEEQKRLFLRGQLADHNRQLAAAANEAGVIEPGDFAVFQDHGYMGLYGGLRSRDIHTRKGLKKSQRILDHMGSTELAANLFRATQAEDKLRREGIRGKHKANQTHYEVGQEVRATIERIGGTMPEDLPAPDQSIQQLQRQESKRLNSGTQSTLFAEELELHKSCAFCV